ncbi:oxidoreductase-like protein family [Lineolata rhizophorae]|uniref:Oxidoreductase-like protein family n=1 Tax=Lineolata rhizophorae TaxID=578093 RepID=A0A6A6NNJ7_9PEZI|nr:oxidoreductase-like protein family [Lineolata rhizophorae]
MAIGIAIVGSGIFAKEQHLPAIQQTPSLELKAVYSRSLKSARSLAEGTPNVDIYCDEESTKTYQDLIKRDDIKAVIIALPILAQPKYIRAALEAGKHVLAEKPVAENVEAAVELINWCHKNVDSSRVTFGIAENFRFLDSFLYAAEQVKSLGKVLHFKVRVHMLTKPGSKYFETPWRKVPEYQGGFLLDGGVHFVAATRLLLQPENAPARVSSMSAQIQPHLPPVDTLDATWRTKTGVTGTFSVSFGTPLEGTEYSIGCEGGVVTVQDSTVKVSKPTGEEKREFPGEGTGVKQEVKAWAESLVSGSQNPRQTPEEALADLTILEAMLRSGENNGTPVDLKYT